MRSAARPRPRPRRWRAVRCRRRRPRRTTPRRRSPPSASMTSARCVLLAAFLLSGSRALADAKADALAEMEKAQENLDRGEYDQAIARYNVARSLFPSSSGPYFGLGLAHARAGRCSEAIPFLE